jgi:hypothetical protein
MEGVKRFEPKRLRDEAMRERVVRDEVLGEVRYRPLTVRQGRELLKIADDYERGMEMIYLKLKPCYPDLAKEDIYEWEDGLAGKLVKLITEDENFRVNPSSSGHPSPNSGADA